MGEVEFDEFPSMKIDCKKIILTTDQDLIKDGVQAIDDDFLEWFVKNPSCEVVDVLKCPIEGLYALIAKEEETKCYCGHTTTCDCAPEETKQETLEEAAYQARRDYQDEVGKDGMNDCIMFDAMKIQKGFKQGAKWQQEQDRWKTVSEEIPPSNIELLVESPEGIVHLSSWRESYNIFSCQAKSESSYNWKWKTI